MTTVQGRVREAESSEWMGFDGLVQLISVDGQRTVGCPYWELVSDVDAAQLRGLYRDMAVVRRLDAEAMALQRQGELGLWAPLCGQEAAQVGSARALRPDDFVVPSYREHGVAYCRGVDPVALLRLWRGTALSGWDPAVHAMATPAIVVGSQALHATGYALGVSLDGAASAVVTYFGDGASSEGDVAEALGFAASYTVPVVFFCQNNQWAISEPVRLQSHATIAQRAQGYGIPGIRVDGNDVLAVLAATRLALARAYAGEGPSLLEAVTYRMGPHTTSDDPTRYRTRAEEDAWQVKDPLARLGALLHREGLAGDAFDEEVEAGATEAAARLRAGCLAMPDPEPADLFEHVYAEPHPLLDEERAAYREYLATFDEDSLMAPATMSLGKALNAGLRQAMERDPKVVLLGEDIGKLGGVFRVTEGLQHDFGERRVIDTPLAESGVVGTAVGLAMRGYRPVCEIQFDGFVYPAFDQIVSQLAKLRHRTEGRVAMPVTIRLPYGGGVGAVEHHSESPEAYFAHTAGLRVVTPSTPADGHRMIQQAIASDDPVVFFEPKRRYWDKGEVDPADPSNSDGLALHDARVVTEGSDATVVAYGPTVATALEAASIAAEEGTSLEVVDLRSLSPVDFDTIEASVVKTGRLVVAHEAPVFCGLGAEIAARISERCFYHLESPVRRAGAFDTPYPPSRLEQHYLPDADRILYEVDRCLAG